MSSETSSKDENPKPSALYFGLVAECRGLGNAIPDRPGHIYFGVAAGKDIPAEILAIQGRIERSLLVVRELYKESQEERFNQIFHEFLSAAQLLAGPKPSPLVSSAIVDQIRETVVLQEGKRIKTQYLNSLGWRVFCVAVVLLVLIAFLASPPSTDVALINFPRPAPKYAAMLVAATVAIWLSFASRKPQLSFDELLEPERDMMGPWHRIVYVLLFTGILALFSAADVATVSIGKFSTGTVPTSYVSALIFGFVCGFSEKLLASTVAPHVTQVLGGLGRTRGTPGAT